MFPSKRIIYSGLAGIGIVLGAAGVASAASSPSSSATRPAAVTVATDAVPTTAAANDSGNGATATTPANPSFGDNMRGHDRHGHGGPGRDQAPPYTSSVKITVPTDGSEPTQAALQAVATVTADQAKAAALASTPGTATKVDLIERGGNVVYEVDVTATAGGNFDVVVDAGNAKVLDTHAEGAGRGNCAPGNGAAAAATPAAGTATTTG